MAKSTTTPKSATDQDPTAATASQDVSDGAAENEDQSGTKEPPPPQLRLKELVDNVAAATGFKIKEVREIVTATLVQLGAALERGDALNLPEFGKARVSRRTDGPDGSSALVLKIRRNGAGRKKEEREALAAAED